MTKAKGNMYEGVDWTHNVIKGICPHGCSYCYMSRLRKHYPKVHDKPLHFDEKALSSWKNKGTVFIGNSCDMWADNVPDDWVLAVLIQCRAYPENKYLFQTKNPQRYWYFESDLPKNCVIGATVETNKNYGYMGNTPSPIDRTIPIGTLYPRTRFITIEPILSFDMDEFLRMLKSAKPDWINIGADSGNNHLPEPEPDKIRELIKELEKFAKIHLKKNLKRLLPEVI